MHVKFFDIIPFFKRAVDLMLITRYRRSILYYDNYMLEGVSNLYRFTAEIRRMGNLTLNVEMPRGIHERACRHETRR